MWWTSAGQTVLARLALRSWRRPARAVASLGLVSPGAATDGVTPIFPKKTDDLFSHQPCDFVCHFPVLQIQLSHSYCALFTWAALCQAQNHGYSSLSLLRVMSCFCMLFVTCLLVRCVHCFFFLFVYFVYHFNDKYIIITLCDSYFYFQLSHSPWILGCSFYFSSKEF